MERTHQNYKRARYTSARFVNGVIGTGTGFADYARV